VVNPGLKTTDNSATDFNHLKTVLVNLRWMEVEKRSDVSYVGCGDGKLHVNNGETCDDGNNISGDGCSATCLIETHFTCTGGAGLTSVCALDKCGNGVLDSGEECDDQNYVSGDGCSLCVVDIGWKCTGTTCVKLCGDGVIST
jgi:cysteine-rich repeat protein